MSQPDVFHFSEGPPQFSRPYLDETTYGQALDTLVIACVDVVLVWGDRILLGERRHPPRPGWWVIGGRMVHGESPMEAVQRKLKEEAGLEAIGSDRLRFIGTFSTRFAERGQPPRDRGLHSINLTYCVELRGEEARAITLDSNEYGRSKWWTWDEIYSALNPTLEMDRALTQILTHIQRPVQS